MITQWDYDDIRQNHQYYGLGVIQNWIAVQVASILTLQALKSMVLTLDPSLGMTLLPTGNSLPISIVTTAPSNAPPGNKGVVFRVSGGVATIYVWDGSAWRSVT